MGYTPYTGQKIKGWPETVLSRGRVVIHDGELQVERGSGVFLPCAKPEAARPLARLVPEMHPEKNFGADL